MRAWPLLAICLLLASCSAVRRDPEILWDTWGIPHIFASDAEGLFHAFGYAQAESHGNLILRLYGQARGRGAEYWGEKYLATDEYVWRMGIPGLAREWEQAQSAEMQRYVRAFTEGVNLYASRHPDRIADEVEVVLPIAPADVFAHTLRVLHFTFVAGRNVVQQAEGWSSAGSNAWAVAPSRAAGGHAMLLANPHLPWEDFYLWFEAQLVAPGVNACGATLVGFPVLTIAFNESLGWSHTVNTYDGADLFELATNGAGYEWDGGTKAFESAVLPLKVRTAAGGMGERKLTVKRSIHGPVVAEKPGKALALRVAGLEQRSLFDQYWDMIRAGNLKEFENALARLEMPMFTVMYADADGHILHLFGGRTPVRARGDWSFWQRPVPGRGPGTLWTRTHAYDELPKVVDPPSGWLQNANDPPWTTTFPAALNPGEFPPYMAPRGMSFRAQRSARMLDEDTSISFAELIGYKHSTRMELADRVLEALIEAARTFGGPAARRGAQILAQWDRSAGAESRGAVLFEAFVREWTSRPAPAGSFAVPWNPEDPRHTPGGLASPKEAAAALETAVLGTEKRHGSADVAWGKVYRLRRGSMDLPANGGPGDLGIFRVVGFRDTTASSGDSYVAAIEFSRPVRARALISYGNSSQPDSPHQFDQLPLFAGKQLRDVWLTRADIEAHLERREILPTGVP